jgi:plastocyanin
MGPVDPAALTAFVLAAEKAEPSKTPFYIAGAVLAAWAVVVAMIGISRPDFPGSATRSRLVMGLSVVLVLTVVTTAVVTAGTPAKGKEGAKPEGPSPSRSDRGKPPPPGPPGNAGAPPGPAPAGGAASTIAIAADPSGQLAYDKKQLQAKPGKVTFDFTNRSPVGHDVTIAQGGTKVAGSSVITGSTTTFTADLKPGSYVFYCSVDSHRQLGMQGKLTVG